MSIGIKGNQVNQDDHERLEQLCEDSYFYTEDFSQEEQVYAFSVLHNPWDHEEYTDSKVLAVPQILKLVNQNQEHMKDARQQLIDVGLEHLANKLEFLVHVTEI
jgi:lysyl-tRNA synthetase class I